MLAYGYFLKGSQAQAQEYLRKAEKDHAQAEPDALAVYQHVVNKTNLSNAGKPAGPQSQNQF
jgi:hypothetical protein